MRDEVRQRRPSSIAPSPPQDRVTPPFMRWVCFSWFFFCFLFFLFCFPPPQEGTVIFFLTTTHQKTHQKTSLTRYNTHNPRFTVREGAVWKEPQVLCVHRLKCLTFSESKFVWWALENFFFYRFKKTKKRKKKKKKDMFRMMELHLVSLVCLLTAFLSCSCRRRTTRPLCCPCPVPFAFFFSLLFFPLFFWIKIFFLSQSLFLLPSPHTM